MSASDGVTITVNPPLTSDQLFHFYERNNICEVGFGKEIATRVLKFPHLIIAAFEGEALVGIVRATYDGLCAHVMEFSLDLRFQGGPGKYGNGSLIEADERGLGARLAERLRAELEALDITFVTGYIVADCEETFFQSIGFSENIGHRVYYIDKRPYVQE